MKTLVIHPSDPTTDFLKPIYTHKPFTVIRDQHLYPEDLITPIKEHHLIIMLGHGSPYGLFSANSFMVDDSLAPILAHKTTVAIWCHADQFVRQHDLHGFYTGMFISEVYEAHFCGLRDVSEQQVKRSNSLFAHIVGAYINSEDPCGLWERIMEDYRGENPIIAYNRERLYHRMLEEVLL